MLRWRAWQLFTVALSLPVLAGILFILFLTPSPDDLFEAGNFRQARAIEFAVSAIRPFMVVVAVYLIQLAWGFQVGTKLARRLPAYFNALLPSFRISVIALPIFFRSEHALLLMVVFLCLSQFIRCQDA